MKFSFPGLREGFVDSAEIFGGEFYPHLPLSGEGFSGGNFQGFFQKTGGFGSSEVPFDDGKVFFLRRDGGRIFWMIEFAGGEVVVQALVEGEPFGGGSDGFCDEGLSQRTKGRFSIVQGFFIVTVDIGDGSREVGEKIFMIKNRLPYLNGTDYFY